MNARKRIAGESLEFKRGVVVLPFVSSTVHRQLNWLARLARNKAKEPIAPMEEAFQQALLIGTMLGAPDLFRVAISDAVIEFVEDEKSLAGVEGVFLTQINFAFLVGDGDRFARGVDAWN